jgi:DNA-binding NarL/FixJ family response regulator
MNRDRPSNGQRRNGIHAMTTSLRQAAIIRILVVDDQRTVQKILKSYLEIESDMEVVGSASDGQTAIEQVEKLRPDVALIDIEMPGIDGLATTRMISQRFPGTKVLVLSGYDDPEYLSRALHSGAKGYLLKATPAEELANAIRSVNKGYFQLGPGLLEKVLFQMTEMRGGSGGESTSSLPPANDALQGRLEKLEASYRDLLAKQSDLVRQWDSKDFISTIQERLDRQFGTTIRGQIDGHLAAVRSRIFRIERQLNRTNNTMFLSFGIVALMILAGIVTIWVTVRG